MIATLQRIICVASRLGIVCSVVLFLFGWWLAIPGRLLMWSAGWMFKDFDCDLTEASQWLQERK